MSTLKKLSFLPAAALVLSLASGCAGGTAPAASQSPAGAASAPAAPSEAAPKADYPSGNIELIIPQNAGGDTDVVGRMFASMLEKELGGTIVCTNLPGGSTSVGLTALLGKKPDGQTMALSATNIALLKPSGLSEITYEDFQAVCGINYDSCLVMIRGDDDRFSTIEELVEWAKANPGSLVIGTGSAGGVWHLGTINFCEQTGIEAVIIPTTGGGGGVGVTLLNKDIDAAIMSVGSLSSTIDAGQIKVAAVLSDEREVFYPDVPTMKELGYDVSIRSSRGLIVHKDTPAEIVATLEAACDKVVNSGEFQAFLDNMYATKMWMNAQEYRAFLQEEAAFYPDLVAAAGLTQ